MSALSFPTMWCFSINSGGNVMRTLLHDSSGIRILYVERNQLPQNHLGYYDHRLTTKSLGAIWKMEKHDKPLALAAKRVCSGSITNRPLVATVIHSLSEQCMS